MHAFLVIVWNSIRDELHKLPKRAFKKHANNMLLSILEAKDDYDEAPILLPKIAMNRLIQFCSYIYLVINCKLQIVDFVNNIY